MPAHTTTTRQSPAPQRDELEHIFAELRAYGNRHNQSESHEEMYNSFIKRVRNNLHIVLAVSPVGEGFRARCLRFPSLVNCCTIDWFSGWPAEALVSVSHIFLAKAQFSTDAKLTSSVTQMIVNVHTSVEEASKKFFTVWCPCCLPGPLHLWTALPSPPPLRCISLQTGSAATRLCYPQELLGFHQPLREAAVKEARGGHPGKGSAAQRPQ